MCISTTHTHEPVRGRPPSRRMLTAPSFASQVAIVTGGADGLGKGITARLASEGAVVVIFDVSDEKMAAAVAEFTAKGMIHVDNAIKFIRECRACSGERESRCFIRGWCSGSD